MNDIKHDTSEKIYESTPATSILVTIMGFFIIGWAFFIYFSHPIAWIVVRSYIYPLDWNIIDFLEYFLEYFFSVDSFIRLWMMLFFLFLMLSSMVQRIKLFELMSDRLEIVKGNNKRFAIPFSDIELIRIVLPPKKIPFFPPYPPRLFKEVNQYNAMKDYKELSNDDQFIRESKHLFKKAAIPYLVGGLGNNQAQGIRISVLRKSGMGWLKVLLPFLHTLENSKHLVFQPLNPREFFEQLYVAYEKWKRLNVKQNQ